MNLIQRMKLKFPREVIQDLLVRSVVMFLVVVLGALLILVLGVFMSITQINNLHEASGYGPTHLRH